MGSWSLDSPPTFLPTAIKTTSGWKAPPGTTNLATPGEVLVCIRNLSNRGATGYAVPVATVIAGNYAKGDSLLVSLTFNENVTVTGTPRLLMMGNWGNFYASYVSGLSTANTMKFRYIVPTNAYVDTNGLGIAAVIDLAGGTILDGDGVAVTCTFTTPGELAQVYING